MIRSAASFSGMFCSLSLGFNRGWVRGFDEEEGPGLVDCRELFDEGRGFCVRVHDAEVVVELWGGLLGPELALEFEVLVELDHLLRGRDLVLEIDDQEHLLLFVLAHFGVLFLALEDVLQEAGYKLVENRLDSDLSGSHKCAVVEGEHLKEHKGRDLLGGVEIGEKENHGIPEF